MRTSERKFLWAFLISVSINVIACAFYIYEWQEGLFPFVRIAVEEPLITIVEDDLGTTIFQELILLRERSRTELFSLLQNKSQISDGYLKRDCALAILFTFHHFDVERALGGMVLQKRSLMLPSQEPVTLLAALTDLEHEKLGAFIEQEKWPITPEGLLLLLQKDPSKRDPALVLAFMRTAEYVDAKVLLMRNGKIPQELASELVLCGTWQDICTLTRQKMAPDPVLTQAQKAYIRLLIAKKPELACEAMVLADTDYSLQTFSDEQLLYVLQRLKTSPALLKELSLAVLQRPRSERVWQQAAIAFCMVEKLPPEYADRRKIFEYLNRTKSKPKPKIEIKKSVQKPLFVKKQDVFHFVQKGDSLWSIAKRYNISVEKLRKINKLQSDSLKPGTKLLIPKEQTKAEQIK